ncbi:MAG TPA: hypothetical protein VFN03_09850 [Trueperaceae bacterium]|nr:hypothetical protein [Trueperaceae bacterium]
MDRHERVQTPGLAVEVAKLRLRVAAEKAEPARLLRQQVARAPFPTIGTALVAGLLLARRSKGGTTPLGSAATAGVIGELLAMFTQAGSEWRR